MQSPVDLEFVIEMHTQTMVMMMMMMMMMMLMMSLMLADCDELESLLMFRKHLFVFVCRSG